MCNCAASDLAVRRLMEKAMSADESKFEFKVCPPGETVKELATAWKDQKKLLRDLSALCHDLRYLEQHSDVSVSRRLLGESGIARSKHRAIVDEAARTYAYAVYVMNQSCHGPPLVDFSTMRKLVIGPVSKGLDQLEFQLAALAELLDIPGSDIPIEYIQRVEEFLQQKGRAAADVSIRWVQRGLQQRDTSGMNNEMMTRVIRYLRDRESTE